MRKTVYILLAVCMASLSSCNSQKTETEAEIVDTIPTMVMQIQKCSRLYTSEYKIHKIVTHEDELKLSGSVMRKDFEVTVPFGERHIAIPINAKLKAYVDFSDFSEKNIQRDGRKIKITLPDPKLMMTSTKTDHEEMKQYVPLLRRNFSDKEITSYEQQGRQQIINDIGKMNIIESARQNSAKTIIPIIMQMGYDESDIIVTFRKEFSLDNLSIEKW